MRNAKGESTALARPSELGSAARMWRLARPEDDERLVELCLQLYREDPGQVTVSPEQARRTLELFRREPWRGRAAALELDGAVHGYALLVSFWSNEWGGEVCEVDELFVAPGPRGHGHGSALFDAIERAQVWPSPPVAIALGVTAGNSRARALYERLGFRAVGTTMARRPQGR
ncbi:MAG TPA: GNAT family N-acetyltransferase [Myxococcales bacterium]|nr:GNAT family N-acetyltransferase [Myxococcales bacterium]